MTKNQSGFSTIAAILIVTIVAVIGFTGWYLMKSAKPSKTATNNQQTQPNTNGADQPGPYKRYKIDSLKLSFQYPEDWTVFDTYPNGIALQSPGFQNTPNPDYPSAHSLYKITSGSILIVSGHMDLEQFQKDDINKTLLDTAASAANVQQLADNEYQFVTIAGNRGVKFSHAVGELLDKHETVYFIKDSKMYKIEQLYSKTESNPYPNLLDLVTSSLKFE